MIVASDPTDSTSSSVPLGHEIEIELLKRGHATQHDSPRLVSGPDEPGKSVILR